MDVARVVLVDDHPVLREGLRNLLKHEPDIEVVGEAGDGFQALQVVEALRPDIVLMDVVMPGLGGIETTRRIKKVSPTTAVVILTAYDDDRYIVGLLEAGAAGYLLKSASAHEVVQSLRAIRAGETVLSPTVAAAVLSRAARAPASNSLHSGSDALTSRELEVLALAARGLSNKEIAGRLSLTLSTVKSHLVNIFSKIGVASRTEAVLEALRRGWVDLQTPSGESASGETADVAPVQKAFGNEAHNTQAGLNDQRRNPATEDVAPPKDMGKAH
ncbi:MAG: response regulator transcription factor [Chloroflexi bacterium]|nr:response regulator transcription factor [Chloroflexota bacterium]